MDGQHYPGFSVALQTKLAYVVRGAVLVACLLWDLVHTLFSGFAPVQWNLTAPNMGRSPNDRINQPIQDTAQVVSTWGALVQEPGGNSSDDRWKRYWLACVKTERHIAPSQNHNYNSLDNRVWWHLGRRILRARAEIFVIENPRP